MKRALILTVALTASMPVLLAAIPLRLTAQAPRDLDELVERRGVYLHPETLEPYTGPVTDIWDETGIVSERGTLANGRWHGVRETFYLDGEPELRETYRNGVLHGPFESYFRTGRLSDKGTYVDGALEGAYEAYWSRAQGDIHAAHMNAAGGADHEGHDMSMMPEAGDLMERGRMVDGRPCGEWYRFVPRNFLGMRTGGTVQYPPCPGSGR